MEITRGLANHQLIPRQLEVVSVAGSCQEDGEVQARWADEEDWQTVGAAQQGAWQARVSGFTVEPRDLQFRIQRESCTVNDLLAGDLWVLAGQSNMVGDGRSAEPETPINAARVYDLADHWRIAEDPLHNRWESRYAVHASAGGAVRRTGTGLSFAKQLIGCTGIPVGLIPCAKGATSLAQWSEFDQSESLYGVMLQRLAAVGPVAGVLWYQGESDATLDQAPGYRQRFIAFINRLRQDLQAPSLPFYYVQIGRVLSFANDPNLAHHRAECWDTVREAQRLTELELAHVGMVTAVDLELENKIHVSSQAHRTLGRRLAQRIASDVYHAIEVGSGPRLETVSVSKVGDDPVLIVTCSGVNGQLCAAGRPHGFSVRDAAGRPGFIVKTRLAGDQILLYLHEPIAAGTLCYGEGIDPYCNIEDQAGQALPATGPIPFGG